MGPLQVTVTPAPASLSAAYPDTLDLLGLLIKASLVAALPQSVIQTARSFLLQQAPTSSGPAVAGRGGGRGGGRSGRGPGAGRGGTSSSAGSTGALQVMGICVSCCLLDLWTCRRWRVLSFNLHWLAWLMSAASASGHGPATVSLCFMVVIAMVL